MGNTRLEEKMLMLPLAKSRQFTLIEMLVVIAIISILASMLFPSITNAISMAHQVNCINIKKQLSLATTSYISDYNGIVPGGVVDIHPLGWVLSKEGYLTYSDVDLFGTTCPAADITAVKWTGNDCQITIGANYNYYKRFGTLVTYNIASLVKVSERSIWMDTRGTANWGGSDGAFAYSTAVDIKSWHLDGASNVVAYLDGHVEVVQTFELENINMRFYYPWVQ